MTGFEMISTGAESLPGAGAAGRVNGQRQASGRSAAESGEGAFAGILAATVAGSAATPAPSQNPETGGATAGAAEPAAAESGSMAETTASAAATVSVDSAAAGSPDPAADSAGEGTPGASGKAPAGNGLDLVTAPADQSGSAAVSSSAATIGAAPSTPVPAGAASSTPVPAGAKVKNGTPAADGSLEASPNAAAPEATVTRNLRTAVPAGTAEGAGAMDQTGTGQVPAGVAPAADSAAAGSGSAPGAKSAPADNPLPGTVLVRGVVAGKATEQGVDGGSQAVGAKQATAAAPATVTGNDQPTAAPQTAAQAAPDQPAAAQSPAAAGVDAGTGAGSADGTSPTGTDGGAQVETAATSVRVGVEQLPGKEGAPAGSRPVDLQAAVKPETSGGSAQTQAVAPATVAHQQTIEGPVRRVTEASVSEGVLARVTEEAKPATASAPAAPVSAQTGGDLSQMSDDGAGSTGSFTERRGEAGTGVSQEAEATDRVHSTFAWATDASRNTEASTVLPVSGEAASRAARVELKDLPQFVRKAELVAAAGGPTEMRVQLVPENLGRMTVRISVTEGTVSARLVVESPEVKALVEQRLPELERSLRDQGLQLSGLSVACEDSGHRDGAFLRDQQQTEWTGRSLNLGSARREYDDRPLGVVTQPVPAGLNHLWTGQGGLLDALA